MMLIPLFLAIIVTTSSPLPKNKEQETSICDTPVETHLDSESKGDPSIDHSLETTDDDKKELYCLKKLLSSSDCSIPQHRPPVFPSTTPLLQSAPRTEHPIERKIVKAISGYSLGLGALYCGMQTGVSLSTYLGLSFATAIGISALLGLVSGAITIHYTWQFINHWFSE